MPYTNKEAINILTISQTILKFCCLIPIDGLSKKANLYLILLSNVYVSMFAATAIAMMVYQFAVGIEDVYATVECVISFFDYISFVYISVIWFTGKKADVKKIFKDINTFLKFCEVAVIKEAEDKVHFYSKLLTIYFCFGITLNGLLPVINIQNCHSNRALELYQKYDPCGSIVRSLYPFDTRGAVRTFSLNLAMIITSCFICFGFLGVTMVLIGLFIHIIAQSHNLNKKLVIAFDEKNEDKMEENLMTCIGYHRAIISYAERVFDVFKLLILVHISITSMIFGLILFFILKLESYADKLRYMAHLTGWLVLLFITCFYGQCITDKSAFTANAAYSSAWYKAPIRLQKSLQLIILRSQRPLALKSETFGVISLVTFLMVVKGAYSFFTVMITVSE
ncbi:odorant receptor 4-like [Anthonomus grandis grandis]|uniref:odorant receptor 4-like n=1 Tax=Anthonomus grandis grandis TaxID=2921223 RepID=UPI0021652CF1|nr:odorant receptor 4-like [Anthonomus grandis grandis]